MKKGPKQSSDKRIYADMTLVLVTVAWGLSNLMIDLCLEEMQALTLNAYRFLGAFIMVAVVMFPRLRNTNRETVRASAILSVLIFVVYALNTYGVKYTLVSNAGFLIALSVLFVPILSIFIKKEMPERKVFIIAVLCTIGVGMMTLDSNFHVAFGDILCLLCAIIYSIYIIINEIFVKSEEIDAFQVGVYQMGFAGILFTISSFILEDPVIPKSGRVWCYLLFLMLISTAFAFIAQSIAQQYTDASRVGVIYTLEPVFSGVAARLVLNEILLPRAYVGEVILVLSMVSMELDFKGLFGRKSGKKTGTHEDP